MKKILAMILVLCAMAPAALATGTVTESNGIGKVVDESDGAEQTEKLEVSGCLGMNAEEFSEMLAQYGKDSRSVATQLVDYVNDAGEMVQVINEIAFYDNSEKYTETFCSIMGFEMGGIFYDMTDAMAAKGWEQTAKNYEGGTLDWSFVKTIGGAAYTFRVWSVVDQNNAISYMKLSVDDMSAHYANVEAGLQLMPAEEA